MWRDRAFLAVVLLAAASCRREVSTLDDAQRVAYSVRPAVVRVSAYATADFRYRGEALGKAESRLFVAGHEVLGDEPPDTRRVVETGAGGSGSGFVIDPDGLLLTSGHVVAPTRNREALERELRVNGAIAALVRHFPLESIREIHRDGTLERYIEIMNEGAKLERVTVVERVELSNGETHPFKVIRFTPALSQRGTDLALLSIERKGLPSLRLGDSDSVRVGETIWSVGYPALASSSDEVIGGWLSRETDLEPTFNPGTITAIRRNVANVPVFQSNVAIYRGNSGGPAVSKSGEVIGISTWGHTSAEQIKFLVPVNVARRFLAAAGIRPSTGGNFDRRYRMALAAASRGDWAAARREISTLMRLFAGSPDLARFARDAERALNAAPVWELHPFVLPFSIGTGLLLVALLMALLLVRLRGRPAAIDTSRAETAEDVVLPSEPVVLAPGAMLGRITILNGPRAGEKFGLGGSGIRIGRESTMCEIVLENPKVSRLHAEVVSVDGKVLLIDRGSSNGTYVNDQKIDRRYLRDGDIIYFGGRNAVAVAFHA